MSVLDRSFIEAITNAPEEIGTFDEYNRYMKSGVRGILRAKVLSHVVEGGGDDRTVFVMYEHENMYILLEVCVGTCSCCGDNRDNTYNSLIVRALAKCYVTTSLDDMETYYLGKIAARERDSEIRTREHLYKHHHRVWDGETRDLSY